ncbi:MAG: AMP-binding protein [Novosphingobium sp.]|nr:AMP-binding protein [Novosphingobium sp.]
MAAHGAAHPDRVALDALDGFPITYGTLGARVADWITSLSRDCPAACPVVLQRDHGVETALIELALLRAGIPVLSLPAFFTARQSQHAIELCGAGALPSGNSGGKPRSAEPAPTPLPVGTARITFTSGSTDTPKGICLSAEHMLTVARSVVHAVGAGQAGRHLALLPPGILLETVAGFFPTLLAGGTYVCPPQAVIGMSDPFRPDFARLVHVIAEQRITSLILVPEYLAGIVRMMEATGTRLPLLTLVAVGGARVPIALIARARLLGLPVRQGYGLTECASVVSLQEEGDDDASSAGRCLPHMRASIATDGEIVLEGQGCLGPVGGERPEAPFHTGDLGRIDDNGRLHIHGRKSNLIVTSFGRNVSPEWVEACLVEQPDIFQALVYGDGLPAPAALIVPSHAGADIEAAVAAANARLPAYARIGEWREVAHFTPMNGQLTGNGRLRRSVIAAAYLDGEPGFFTELEARTVRERLRFMSTPQLQAGLAGAITRDVYLAYLAQAWHHVRHTVPLMRAARAQLAGRPEIVAALDDYIAEETGHEEWILADIAAAGGDAEAVRASEPAPTTLAMVDHAYDRIVNGNAMAFFGMVYVLESTSVALATHGASAIAKKLELPPEAFTYLNSHGSLDRDHMRFFADLMNGLSDRADRAAILTMAREMFGLFGGVFASIDLERAHVPA